MELPIECHLAQRRAARFAWQGASLERYPRRSPEHSRLPPAPTAFSIVGNAKIAAPIVFTTLGNNVDPPPMTRFEPDFDVAS